MEDLDKLFERRKALLTLAITFQGLQSEMEDVHFPKLSKEALNELQSWFTNYQRVLNQALDLHLLIELLDPHLGGNRRVDR